MTAAIVFMLASPSHAAAKPDNVCSYLMKDSLGGYYDYSSMYRDADLAVIGRISNVESQTPEQGLMTLNISKVIKGDKTVQSLSIPYTHASSGNTTSNSDLILPTTREYLFFLKKTSPTTATRIICPYQVSNGWVEHNDLHFSEKYSVPLVQLKSFIESNKAVVPAP